MTMSRNIYNQLIQLPCVPPEMGGILGCRSGTIDVMVIDISKPSYHNGTYVPNVSFLNECIEKWNDEKIIFKGMFHTHALNWLELSADDKRYIIHIMKAMPDSIDKLYFPLVFPLKFVKVFCAERSDSEITIKEDGIEIF